MLRSALLCLCLIGFGQDAAAELLLQSASFEAGGTIPAQFTCEGEDQSPPLSWSGLPQGTRSLALIVDDPDAPDPAAPKMTWVHWVLYDLPADSNGLSLNAAKAALPPGSRQGRNDWGRPSWGGPCPPIGEHRYVFTLYALDRVIGGAESLNKAQLLQAMQGHVLARAELIGRYQKRG